MWSKQLVTARPAFIAAMQEASVTDCAGLVPWQIAGRGPGNEKPRDLSPGHVAIGPQGGGVKGPIHPQSIIAGLVPLAAALDAAIGATNGAGSASQIGYTETGACFARSRSRRRQRIPMVSLFDLFAFLVLLTAAFGWFNELFFKLPANIGLLLMGIAASLIVLLVDVLVPGIQVIADVGDVLRQIDFYEAVMHGMLGFLLFAGALHVDWQKLRRRLAPVMMMATVGVVISTFVIGLALWGMAPLFGIQLPLVWALVFGALISPTDPVAVLSMLKAVRVPELLETEMSGESLLNDGVGVVLFTILVAVAASGNNDVSVAGAAGLFVLEAFGGALLGLAAGYVAFRAMRSIDEYVVEIFISLALVTATYAAAERLHISGPIAVVVAGLLIGERGPTHAMSETTQKYLFSFWTMVDELLNSILFLLIGLELLVVGVNLNYGWLAIAVIPLVIVARTIAIAVPIAVLTRFMRFIKGTMPVMVWGGVRGGISIALALSLPYTDERPIILTATYAVVLFTIIVQGLTLKWVIRCTVPSSRLT